jgi:hypothetical protein
MSSNKKTIPTEVQIIDRGLQVAQVKQAETALGQLGSSFADTTGAVTPPSGKVFVAISFLADTSLSELISQTAVFASTASGGSGSGTDAIAAAQIFPKGFTLYGRYTSFTLNAADADGGVIAYIGE